MIKMGNNDNIKKYSEKIKTLKDQDNTGIKLRNIHINVEKIYEEIKTHKSSFIYKTIFYLLFVISLVVFIIHIYKSGFSYSTFFMILLILYFFYYLFIIKKAIRENIKTRLSKKIDPENPEFLNNRINYISEGIKVTTQRAYTTRNFYIIFFPLMSLTLIDILKGPFDFKGYLVTFIVAVLIGGVFWFYYFRNDITDIESDIEELNKLTDIINKFSD